MRDELLKYGIEEEDVDDLLFGIEHDVRSTQVFTDSRLVLSKSERYVLGPVLIPNVIDLQGHIIPYSTVRKVAHKFNSDYRVNKYMHQTTLNKNDVSIVESYVAPVDFEVNGRVITKGSWVMALKIHNDELWNKVLEGSIRGFSIGGQLLSGSEVL